MSSFIYFSRESIAGLALRGAFAVIGVLALTFSTLNTADAKPAGAPPASPAPSCANYMTDPSLTTDQILTCVIQVTIAQGELIHELQDQVTAGNGGVDQSAEIAALQAELASAQGEIADLQARVGMVETDLSGFFSAMSGFDLSDLSELFNLGDYLEVDTTTHDVSIVGANVHILNGEGKTDTTNSLGNLILGYNEIGDQTGGRTGSHNLVVGYEHSWTSYAGVVVGHRNTISGAFASILGGYINTASGDYSSVLTGTRNVASGGGSSISGGIYNDAIGLFSSILGGDNNTVNGDYSSIGGGENVAENGDYNFSY